MIVFRYFVVSLQCNSAEEQPRQQRSWEVKLKNTDTNMAKLDLLASVMDVEEARKNVLTLKNNRMGIAFIARASVYLVAPKRTAKEFADMFGYDMPTLTKVSLVTNSRCPKYEDKTNRALAKDCNEPNFEAEAPNGCEWVVYPVLKRVISTGELLFTISFTENDKTNSESVYYVGDRRASDKELAFIQSHLRPKSYSKKQAEHGLIDMEAQIQVRNYKLHNLVTFGTIGKVKEVWQELTV